MKHLGFDTLHRVSGPCGAFLCCCALAFCLTLVPAFAVEEDVPSVEFLSLDPEPVTGESLGFATAVVRSPSDGSLWIGMAEKGLLRIGRNGRRIRYTQQSGHLPSDQIKGLCASSDGVIYILDARGQVMRYSSVEGFKSLSGLPDIVISMASFGDQVCFLLESGAVYVLVSGQSPTLLVNAGMSVSLMTSAPDGRLFLAGPKGSIFAVSDGKAFAVTALPEAPNCISVSSEGTLWAGVDHGVYHLTDGCWRFYDLRDALPSGRVVSLCSVTENRLWIATGRGLCCLDVSNSNVSKSEIYLPEETFLPLSSSVDSDRSYYIGGVRGVAAVALDGVFSLAPWTAPEPDGPVSSGGRIPFWCWIVMAILLAACFVLGTRFRKSASGVVFPVVNTPSTQDATLSSVEVPVQNASPARPSVHHQLVVRANTLPSSSSLSPDELFQLLEKLDNSVDDTFVNSVYGIIKDSYCDSKLSVEDIAQHLNLTRVHVNRKLQASLGVSPSLLLKAYRMRLASSLLVANEIPVSEIASQSGFSSSSYFSSAFKDFFGQSPSEYIASRMSAAK